MQQANIPSLSPYYVNKSGQVFNSKYVLINGSYNKKENIHVLSFTNTDGQVKSIPFTRLVYLTFFPNKNISNCTIIRKNVKLEFKYDITNLECIANIEMPLKNGISNVQPNLELYNRCFYKKFDACKLEVLKKQLANKHNTLSHLSKIYEVSDMAIYRARKKFNNQ